MKRIISILTIILLSLPIYSNSRSLQEKFKETYVVYYFGATSCGYCNVSENIEKIKKIKTEFSVKYKDSNIKFVMVCMDENIEEGLKFIKKYGYWDEISIGKFYNNELALNYLNKTEIPGVPHVMVYKDLLVIKEKLSIPIIKERKLLVDLVGGTQIGSWINDGYPLKNQ